MTKVVLEVGHGPFIDRNGNQGFEEGANGQGTTEYKELKEIASVANGLLEAKGYDVTILDPPGTLGDIGRMAAGSDIFVSLHLNAFNGQVQGTETLIHRNGTAEDLKLAQTLQSALVNKLGLTSRGVKRQGLAVLSGVPLSVRAACLTESFFVDSVDAATARAWALQSAEAIADGIDQYAALAVFSPRR